MRVTAGIALLLAVLGLLLAACGDGDAEVEAQATVAAAVRATAEAQPTVAPALTPLRTPLAAPAVLSTSPAIRADNSLIAEISVTLDRPAQVYVEYENAVAGRFRTMATASPAKQHVVPVVRLRPSTAYRYQAFAIDEEGRVSAGVGGTFTTGELPEVLAALEFAVEGRPTPELILLDHRDVASSYIVVLDGDSKIVWYYASPNPLPDVPYAIMAVRQKPNYNLVYYVGNPPQPCCLREITPTGEIVDSLSYSEFDGVPHHDHLVLPDNQVLYIASTHRIIDDTAQGGDAETPVEGDSLRIWDQDTGITREVWNAFDSIGTDVRVHWAPGHGAGHSPPGGIPGQPSLRGALKPIEWTVANSLSVGPRGNYIVSFLTLEQIISISPDFKRIEWTLGGPNSDYVFIDPNDRPYKFHSVSELPNGNLLIFDNGQGRPEEEGGEYSRVIELVLDRYDLRVTKAWEYRPEPDLFARIQSSAFRLDNGNTLVSFDTDPRVLVEVDESGAEVWKLVISGTGRVRGYRAYPFSSIMGETLLK